MKTNLYVIFDSKAKIYNKPFCLLNDQVALRAAADILNDTNTDIAQHPFDFSMFKIGEYDDETAQIINYDKFEILCRFHELSTVVDLEPRNTVSEPPLHANPNHNLKEA